MAGTRKKSIPGKDDSQIFLLRCPTCNNAVSVTNYRHGELDRVRGIHHVNGYGWKASCSQCETAWGNEEGQFPSLWTLADFFAKEADN